MSGAKKEPNKDEPANPMIPGDGKKTPSKG